MNTGRWIATDTDTNASSAIVHVPDAGSDTDVCFRQEPVPQSLDPILQSPGSLIAPFVEDVPD